MTAGQAGDLLLVTFADLSLVVGTRQHVVRPPGVSDGIVTSGCPATSRRGKGDDGSGARQQDVPGVSHAVGRQVAGR